MEHDLDEVVCDLDEEPARSRVPTKPFPKGSLEIDCSDGVAVAEFLELMARLVRTRKKIRIVLE